MSAFFKRNLLLYFRDRGAVLFSLLAVFIVIGLYAIFLGDVWNDYIPQLSDTEGLMESWLCAGLLAIATITTTMGAFGVMVDDKVKKIQKDFYASPVRRGALLGGYLGSALLVGLLMSLVTLLLSAAYIRLSGGAWPGWAALCEAAALLLLCSFANTAMVGFLVSLLKSHSAFVTVSTVLGTLVGFVTGTYLPIGTLPEAVQYVVKLFPLSQGAALLRQALMRAQLDALFTGAPAAMRADFEEFMGLTYHFGDTPLPGWAGAAILLGTGLLFLLLAMWRAQRGNRA